MISKFFFVVLLIYIIYAIFLAREKYHLLLIPFILDSNFLGFFTLPLGEKTGDLVFLVIVLLWIFFLSYKQRTRWTKRLLPYRIILLVFFSFLFIVLIISILQYGEPGLSVMVFRRLFRYISIVLFISIMFRIEKQELAKLGNIIEYITVGLSFLYIINSSLGLKIFEAESYGQYTFEGTQIFRNFAALPYFLIFSLAHVTLKERKGIYEISAIFIFFITLFLSYTRSLVLMGFIITLVAFFIRSVKFTKSIVQIIKLMIAVPAMIALVIIILTQVFPTQSKYFLNRINYINNAQSALSDHNVSIRSKIIESRLNKVLEVNPLTGLGFIHEESSSMRYHDLFIRKGDKKGQVIVGDQSWGNLIALIGFLGIAIYLMVILYPIVILITSGMFFKQSITCIASVLYLLEILFINSFFDTVLLKGVYLISLLIAYTVVYFNYTIIEQSEQSRNKIQ